MSKQLSIRSKLAVALWGAAILAFAVAFAALHMYQKITLEQRVREALEPYAQLVSVGAEAAVRFEDSARAQEILNTLRANPQILSGQIRLANGELLAAYASRSEAVPLPAVALPGVGGIAVGGDVAVLEQALVEGANLRLVLRLAELGAQARSVALVFLGGLVGLLAATTLGLRAVLERSIVQPVATLAETLEQVRTRADYQQRVPMGGAEEMNRLSRSFNAMMEAIEQREGDLRRLASFQKTLVESAAYGIISTDQAGVVTSFNRAAERLLGYRAAEVVGKMNPVQWHDRDEMAARARRFSSELQKTVPADFEVFAVRARDGLVTESEWTCVRRDGTRVPVLLSVTGLRDEHDVVTGFIGLLQDLTERKKQETALREKTEELDRFFSVAPDLLCIANTDGQFLRVNPAWERTLGYSPEELYSVRFLDLVHPDDQQATAQAMARLADQQPVNNFVNRYRCRDGSYRWIEWCSVPTGTLIYAAARDITERVRADEEIRQLNQELDQRVRQRTAMLESANKELESFCYSVSHDLRAPLRSIDGFSRIVLEECGDNLDGASKENLGIVRGATKRMGQLIDDMLRLSRISRGEMRWADVDLSQLAGQVAETLRQREPARRVEFVIAPGCRACGDAALLTIVLENVLGNAWKYTSHTEGARIEFGVKSTEAVPVFFVRDNGCGFDMKYVHKLFAAFQRLHTDAEFPGTGIGLASVQRVVRRHGGRVWIEGEPGRGATLYFTLSGAESNSHG